MYTRELTKSALQDNRIPIDLLEELAEIPKIRQRLGLYGQRNACVSTTRVGNREADIMELIITQASSLAIDLGITQINNKIV